MQMEVRKKVGVVIGMEKWKEKVIMGVRDVEEEIE